MKKYIKILISLPKTFWFNIRAFGIKRGIKMPVLISYDVKTKISHGGIFVPPDLGIFKIRIGVYEGTLGIEKNIKGGYIYVSPEAQLIFKGEADLKTGITIIVSGEGTMTVGNGFTCNRNCCFSCDKAIEIGDDALLGWNVKIRTSDGHSIYGLDNENIQINQAKSVKIGEHVWLAAEVEILKGAIIPNGCVVGYRSLVTKEFTEQNSIIAGYPAKVVKSGISWKRD